MAKKARTFIKLASPSEKSDKKKGGERTARKRENKKNFRGSRNRSKSFPHSLRPGPRRWDRIHSRGRNVVFVGINTAAGGKRRSRPLGDRKLRLEQAGRGDGLCENADEAI